MRRRVPSVLVLVLTAALWLVPGAARAADPLADAQRFTDLLNGERVARGLPALVVDARLTQVAVDWSSVMATTGSLAHNPAIASLIPAGWTRWAENVGYGGSVQVVHDALMASPGHRANILDPAVNAIGIGVAYGGGLLWVTQDFMQNSTIVPVAPAPQIVGSGPGYRLVGAGGAVTTFADSPSLGSVTSASRIVGGASTPSGLGCWIVDEAGRVQARGDAGELGDLAGRPLAAPIVGIAATPSGGGYWLLGRDGGVFSFGDAAFHGSTGGLRLNQPVVGIAATRTGQGYWFVAADGGIFSFGDAAFQGSTGALRLNQPIVGMAADPATGGYWLVARDGGIFSFDAPFLGSTGALRLNQPIVGMVPSPTGGGYRFVASDGGVFTFGDAGFRGSLGTGGAPSPIVALLAAV